MMPRLPPRAAQRGLSLIELMIAMTLGLLIMTALVTLFVDTSRANREMAKTNSQIESARFAIELLSGDMVHGGYWGGYVPSWDDLTFSDPPTDVPTGVPADSDTLPPVCESFADWDANYVENILSIPVQFYNGVPTGCSDVVEYKQASTDVVVVRHAGTCAYNWNVADDEWKPGRYDTDGNWEDDTNCEAYDDTALYFQASRCEDDAEEFVLSDDPSDFTLRARACETTPGDVEGGLAPMYRFVSNLYYVRQCAVLSGSGNCTGTDTIPTLVRVPFDVTQDPPYGAPQALVEGIENLQVGVGVDFRSETGVDIRADADGDGTKNYAEAVEWDDPDNHDTPVNRGDGLPDVFLNTCGASCTVEELANVSAGRIFVLARATEPTPGYTDTRTYQVGSVLVDPNPNDGFKRHVFTQTVRFVNVTARRETP